MTRCAMYSRVSLEEQVERFGLASQKSELRAYAASRGYEVLRELSDEGYSGVDLGRPALAELRQLVRNRAVSVVVVHDPDRLARKLAHQLILTEEFEKYGVRLEFLSTPNIDTVEGRLLLNVRGVISEFEREKIRERTMRGRREKARQGLIVGGRCPYGYRTVASTYRVCETEADTVRLIFRWLVEDRLSIRVIVEKLNQGGYKPHSSDRWAKSSVSRILRNSVYIGEAYYNRRERIMPEESEASLKRNKKTAHRWRAKSEWIPQTVPQIISKELFQLAQVRLAQNSEHCSGRPAKTIYLLKGILRCSVCGRKYAGNPTFKDKYYRCTGRERLANPRCTAPSIAASLIEPFIWHYMVELLSDPGLLTSKLALLPSDTGGVGKELARLDRELQEIARKETRLLNAFMDAAIELPGMREKAAELASLKTRLVASRDLLRQKRARGDSQSEIRARIVTYCALLRAEIPGLDESSQQKLLRTVVDDVVLNESEVTIRTILPTGPFAENRSQRADDWSSGFREDDVG